MNPDVPKHRSTIVRRRNNRLLRRLTVYLGVAVAERLMIACVRLRCDVSAALEAAVIAWLALHEPKAPATPSPVESLTKLVGLSERGASDAEWREAVAEAKRSLKSAEVKP